MVGRTPIPSMKRNRWMRLAVEVGLVVALALLAARIAWLVIAPETRLAVEGNGAGAQPVRYADSVAVPVDRSVLSATNPFVRDLATEVETVPDDADAPETRLNLSLNSLITNSRDSSLGSAGIFTPSGQQVMVQVGEEIIEGVTLERVYMDRVTIRSQGRLETLTLREDRAPALFSDAPADNASVTATPDRENVTASDLLAGINLVPIAANGAIQGFTMSPRGTSDVLQRAGLQTGDILKTINGRAVNTLEREDLQETFLDFDRVSVTVERGGTLVNVAIVFAEES